MKAPKKSNHHSCDYKTNHHHDYDHDKDNHHQKDNDNHKSHDDHHKANLRQEYRSEKCFIQNSV